MRNNSTFRRKSTSVAGRVRPRSRYLAIGRCACVVVALCATVRAVRADLVLLEGGRRVTGHVLESESNEHVLVVRLRSRETIELQRQRVREVLPGGAAVERYVRIRDNYPDTAEGQWQLAEWCREHRLRDLREKHLRRVVQLDPDHETARRVLGYVHHEGRWITREEHMADRGFVRYRGRWVLSQEKALLEEERRRERASRKWFGKVKLWAAYVRDAELGKQQLGLRRLHEITDPAAIAALDGLLAADEDDRVRLLFVEVVADIDDFEATRLLVLHALEDSSDEVRWAAVDALVERQDPGALRMFVQALESRDNLRVRRAAVALGEMGDTSVVLDLVDALVTRHRVATRARRGTGIGFSVGSTGLSAGGDASQPGAGLPFGAPVVGGMRLAAGNPRKVLYEDVENSEVLFALNELTGENFGYDQEAWRQFWADANRPDGPAPAVP